MYPTYKKPMIVKFGEKVPALKNNREPYVGTSKAGKKFAGHKPSKKVTAFMSKYSMSISDQMSETDFQMIPIPLMVGMVCRFVFYVKTPGKLPTSDAINGKETIQDTLQGIVYEDDRQILLSQDVTMIVPNSLLEHAVCWVWVVDPQVPYQEQIDAVIRDFVIGKDPSPHLTQLGWNWDEEQKEKYIRMLEDVNDEQVLDSISNTASSEYPRKI